MHRWAGIRAAQDPGKGSWNNGWGLSVKVIKQPIRRGNFVSKGAFGGKCSAMLDKRDHLDETSK
jgi:hypothetical protein